MVDPCREVVALLRRRRGVVGRLVDPTGHECAVLADDDAIVDDGRVVQKVGEGDLPVTPVSETARPRNRHRLAEQPKYKYSG